jgi:hypothetical protein
MKADMYAEVMDMSFVVFEDLETKNYIAGPGDASVKIHRDSCRFYTGRKIPAPTVRWHGPSDSIDEAEQFARSTGKGWARARCCP